MHTLWGQLGITFPGGGTWATNFNMAKPALRKFYAVINQ